MSTKTKIKLSISQEDRTESKPERELSIDRKSTSLHGSVSTLRKPSKKSSCLIFDPRKHQLSPTFKQDLHRCPSYEHFYDWDKHIKEFDATVRLQLRQLRRPPPISKNICDMAKRNKLRMDKTPKPIDRPVLPMFNDSHEKLKVKAAETFLSRMTRDWRKLITGSIPLELMKSLPESAEKLLLAIDDNFTKTNLLIGSRQKINPTPGAVDEFNETFSLKYQFSVRRTENYPKFLKHREYLERELYITRPLFQKMRTMIMKQVPSTLVEFERFAGKLRIPFIDMYPRMEEIITTNKLIYLGPIYEEYKKAIAKVLGDKLQSPILPDQSWIKYMVVVKKFIALGVMQVFLRTVDNLLAALSDPTMVQFIECHLTYTDNLDLTPSIGYIYEFYHKTLNLITTYSQVIIPECRNVPIGQILDCRKAVVKVPDYMLNEFKNMINNKIDKILEPIHSHFIFIRSSFKSLFERELILRLEQYLRDDHDFDDICEQLNNYISYINIIDNMDDFFHFMSGVIDQRDLLTMLRRMIEDRRANIVGKLIEKNTIANLDICSEFEGIVKKAKRVPTNIRELTELGDYMTWVKGEYIAQLKERMDLSLQRIFILMDISPFTEYNLDLNTETLTWLSKIVPALEAFSSMYELRKAELEDELKKALARLEKGFTDFLPRMELLNNMSDPTQAHNYIKILRAMTVTLQEFDRILKWSNEQEKLLKIGQSSYPELEECKDILYPFYDLIWLCAKWNRHNSVWLDGPFENIVIEDVESAFDDYYKDNLKFQKTYRTQIRMAIAQKNPKRFKGTLDEPDLLLLPAPLQITAVMTDRLKEFRPIQNLINIMRNPALLQRHWDEMSKIAGQDMTPNAGTTLRKIVDKQLNEFYEAFEIVSMGATKELGLKNLLAKMKSEWEDVFFKTMFYKDSGQKILTGIDDIQAILDDHITKTLSMRGSAFVKPIEAEVQEWYARITRLNSTIDVWTKVQQQWCYLLPIFSSKDIVNQMPQEGSLFKEVDITFKRYMQQVEHDGKVIEVGPAPGVLEAFEESLKNLDKINEGVTNYLEKKRLYFPRFFFLSNDEMLEILSETKDPLRVQPHLRKCFEGISSLYFDKKLVIHSMFSGEGENVAFLNTIDTEETHGAVEKWLIQVENQMLKSVRQEIEKSVADYAQKDRIDWVVLWEGQVVLCVSQIYWARNAERCLHASSVPEVAKFHSSLVEDLTAIVRLVRSPDISNLARITIKALIVIDVHAKDVVQMLVETKVDNINDFAWLAQMRYYWEGEALIRIINALVSYAYEYLGNSDRLVITPLTDRCYRTLIGAYQLHLNGAPEGPAGTGKTETTKDLAKALAVQCVVFNCSDGLDYKAMGKFFKGLASSGAWACFDEFNRIELEVLSVVAQQILCIVLAVRGHLEYFLFEGTTLKLKPTCYVCITMNPGYAGRSELPDNLKVLFRTVAMMVPDYALIGEISLYSYGFVDARKLSVKIVQTYRLCSEQLSSQNHYDYGMRAVKTVLSAAGNNKLAYPDENEDVILLRSITDVNLPKFLSFDVPLFNGIISDLFPGIVLPTIDYTVLLEYVHELCDSWNLQPTEAFLEKIIQTYEMMIVRHGFMLVGEPFGGKTCCLHMLAETLTLLHKRGYNQAIVEYQTINPKSITMGQLYGQFDPVSYDWSDGVVATCYRGFAMDPSPNRKWVIFDGPVDAVWIENMNTVLDDNKKLCLMSGEVIAMSKTMSMIFEVMDLAQASPATVSRCGMIYTEAVNIGWDSLALSWVRSSNPAWTEEREEFMMSWLVFILKPTLYFVTHSGRMLCFGGEMNLVKSTLNIIEMLMEDAVADRPDDGKFYSGWFQASLITGVSWGVGGSLDHDTRIQFDEFHKSIWEGTNDDYPQPAGSEIMVTLPSDGMYMDYLYQYRMKGSWKYWPEEAKSQPVQEAKSLHQTLVPTLDVVRYMFFFSLHIKYKKRLLLIGSTGTGKTFYIQNMLMKKLSMEQYEPSFITFTVQISANQTQNLIISKLFKWKRGKYGPTKGKEAVIFVDDINLPAKEIYGAQPPIELLRQYFDHGHWYDRDTSKLFLYNLTFLAAMGPVGGSRQEIYQRFLRHFNIYSINTFSDESMFKIFSNTLMQGLKKNGFGQDVMMMSIAIVNASIDIYKRAIASLRPTPLKSHYLFNLRDMHRITLGCSMMKKEVAGDDKHIFVRLWVHEVMRVFYDRLVDKTDRDWFFEQIKECVKDYFKVSFKGVFEEWLPVFDDQITQDSMRDLLFGTCLDLDSSPEERRYEQMPSIEVFENVALTALEDYNATHKTKMNIVLFRYALEHLSKINRIISMPVGSGMLVGVGGSGRQSVTRLAGAISGFNTFQPEITKNYGRNEWRDDLKLVLKQSGGLGKDIVFLFNEGQIKEEVFLEDIDGLLNTGEVPNIYAIDEKQEILELTRLAAQGGNRALDVSPLEVFSFFTNRCKEKTHIVLCFSPIGAALRLRLRMYPAFVNCCTIDWFEDWPENALEMVAERAIADVNLDQQLKEKCVVTCKHFHVGARKVSDYFYAKFGRKTYITSASYLDLIKCFVDLYNSKQDEITSNRNRYIVGLDQLAFAAEQIAIMQVDLNALKPKLVEMADKVNVMMRAIEKETVGVEETSALVRKDEEAANIQADAAQALKSECEADLAVAMPVLEQALSALDTLKPADITLVKSMKNPPEAVKLILAAVCVMKGLPPDKIPDPSGSGRQIQDYWGPSKRILGDMNFLQNLKDYNKDNIPEPIIAKIRKEYLTQKNFNPDIVAKASTAAKGLCQWIIALDKYDKVIKVVAPKKAKLAEAEAQFNETMALLTEKRNMLRKLEEKLEELNKQLAAAEAEKKRLSDDVQMCIDKLYRAEKLIGGLGGEKDRWIQNAENLLLSLQTLSGDILLSCGIIAYLSPLNLILRVRTIDEWHQYIKDIELPTSDSFLLREILGVDVKIQYWYINKLPNDTFSTENAIIQDISKRRSLLIDPQRQANVWIRTMEKKNKLMIVKFTIPTYMKTIEHAIEYGNPVLIENIGESLEAPIFPILDRNTYFQGGVEYIALGDQVIELHKNFKLYMTTTLRNPHYLPEVFNKVTIVNFSLTIEGLEDQLLGIVVAKERPDLQAMREKLIVESADNKKKLKEVETLILKTMSETEGNILEDQTAIDILDSSKTLSKDIQAKQEVAAETEIKIEKSRLSYTPVAKHSAVLYYCISDLPNVDPMYQYSLGWFISLYISSITNASKSSDLAKRLKFLIATFDYDLYQNVCRSLFEKDKLLFSFILCTKLLMAEGKMDLKIYMWFLTGGASLEASYPNPAHSWVQSATWNMICQLDEIGNFHGFRESFSKNINKWEKFYDLTNPQDAPLPDEWNNRLSPFEKMIVVRVVRPDKTKISISKFVANEMGDKFISPPPFDIARSYEDSTYQYPLIFILSPGVDPMASLQSFAEKMNYDNRFQSISLGQGQGPIAEQMIAEAQTEENWVCLQNCHLAVSWMATLERICESFDRTNTRRGFRLWLTSYPSDKFPIPVLQNGVKMTNEPPQGLTQNILRTYKSEPVKDEDFYAGCPAKEQAFHRLLYGMTFFHAVIQERRTFGPIGWNIAYGFNESDYQISVLQLQNFLNEYESIPYVAISYLAGECNYGGRVTDDWDRRCLTTILKDFINEKVVMDTKYLFIEDEGPAYGLPRRTEYELVLQFIQQLPVEHPPEVVGLHMNAGIRRDYNNSMTLLNSAILVQGTGGGGAEGGDALLLAIIDDILHKIPKPFNMEFANHKYPTVYEESMNTVLCQELQRFNRLLGVIASSLRELDKALHGLVVMTPALEAVSETLLLGKIPGAWAKVSYPSLKTLSGYVIDFVERMTFLNDWLMKGKPGSFWLSGFFFTQAFLTGAKQNFARKFKIAIDRLTFDFQVLKTEFGGKPPPNDGVHCYGVFLEGARWNLQQGCLDEQKPKVLYESLPCVWIVPLDMKSFKQKGRYTAPLYKTSERKGTLSTTGHSTNYVLPFLLETKKPISHWVKRSVALLCQLD